jgi:hypothetical protein
VPARSFRAFRPDRLLVAATFVLVSASLWIACRFHIPELQVLFLFHIVSSLGSYLLCNCEAEEYFRAPHCGMKPQCGLSHQKWPRPLR